jgi:hypothetical protein
MSAFLNELMRHADISITMKYYVRQNATNTAVLVWNLGGAINTITTSKVPPAGFEPATC